MKVTVIGAAGGIGQPLSLLLKQSPYVTELSLYDVVNAPGVAKDISHINTPAPVSGFFAGPGWPGAGREGRASDHHPGWYGAQAWPDA